MANSRLHPIFVNRRKNSGKGRYVETVITTYEATFAYKMAAAYQKVDENAYYYVTERKSMNSAPQNEVDYLNFTVKAAENFVLPSPRLP